MPFFYFGMALIFNVVEFKSFEGRKDKVFLRDFDFEEPIL